MPVRRREAPVAGEVTATVWFHPQRGAALMAGPVAPRMWSYRGGSDGDWRPLATVRAVRRGPHDLAPLPGQALPKGFLWADPSRQVFGLGGPRLLYGPMERTCSACQARFVWSARAQQHLFEVVRVNDGVIARLCQPCARARNRREAARADYARALREVEAAPSARAHLALAEAVVALHEAGGRASLERALGHCRKAVRLGAGARAERVERRLQALRAGR